MTGFIYWSWLGIVVLTPLYLAAVRPWTWSLISFLLGILMLFWSVLAYRHPEQAALGWRRHWPVSVPFLIVFAWALVQTFGGTPATLHHDIWREAAIVLNIPPSGAISLDPMRTLDTAMRWLAYGSVFWLAMQMGRDPVRAERALWAIIIAASAYALYGFWAHFDTGAEKVLWYRKIGYQKSITGTFFNANAFAIYIGLALLCAFAFLGRAWTAAAGMGLGSRTGILTFFDRVTPRLFFLLLMIALLGTVLLLTLSRGGLLTFLIGIFILVIAYFATGKARKSSVAALFLVAVIGGGLLAGVSGKQTSERLGFLVSGGSGGRTDIHALTIRALEDRPLTGAGLGAFDRVFFMFHDTGIPWKEHRYEMAHSTYLELAVEIGIPATILLMFSFIMIGARCLIGAITRRKDTIYPALALASLATISAQALFDFGMQIPAVAVTFFAIAGIGFAQSWHHARSSTAERSSER